MGAFNTDIDFNNTKYIPQHHREAFIGTGDNKIRFDLQPKKVLLKEGMRLYKFNSYDSLIGGGMEYCSEWWSPYDPYEHDPGWEAKKRFAQHHRVSVREIGRLTSAIKEDWNSLAYLLEIRLKVSIYAFFGGFASMPRISTPPAKRPDQTDEQYQKMLRDFSKRDKNIEGASARSARLPGGATQFYIPKLRPGYIDSWKTTPLT